MLFTSKLFLFAFLPTVIFCYYGQKLLAGNRLRNACLLVFSYLFYFFGASTFVLILALSTFTDYCLGLLIDRFRRYAKVWAALSVLINLGLLAYFKYANFMIAETTVFLERIGLQGLHWPAIVLPIGISFFTFQKLSYIFDVYRCHARAMINIGDFALYVAMFPQLVAGPIVRFKDIWDQLKLREETWELFYTGSLRFCWGLGKKVLIADACGQIADVVFATPPALLDTKTAWLGALAYCFQIYFDFSAYSDMAIGLARLFGFQLKENFNRPYAATSITDFWRRWHISLSTWFRDYLYIPLGGNRKGRWRTYLNLIIVFVLCGLWHGANWTFLVWGLYHGFFLVLERAAGGQAKTAIQWYWLKRLLTMTIIVFGWVLFRSGSLSEALLFMKAMVVYKDLPIGYALFQVLNWRNITFLSVAFGATLAAPGLMSCEKLIQTKNPLRAVFSAALILLILPYCAAFVLQGAENAFIYYRF